MWLYPLYVAGVLICIVLASGCKGGDVTAVPYMPERAVVPFVHPYDAEGNPLDPEHAPLFATGVAPIHLDAYVWISAGDNDRGEQALGELIEIDFGDGSGWINVTEQMKEYNSARWFYEGQDPQDLYIRHTYTEPGEYVIRARATFWDGEVVYSESAFEPTITVLAADG
ncbi:hypothetical protein IIA79_06355 [bacterium]|nr:hypothetical protein [bacterium]